MFARFRFTKRLREAKKEPKEPTERLLDVPNNIAGLLSDTKLRGLRKHFHEFDADRSGFIDSGELASLLRALGFNPSDVRIQDILQEYDTDNNGNLSFGEFVEVWAYYCQEAAMESTLVQKAFHFFDQDDSKSLTYSEFRSVLTQTGEPLTQEEVSQFFALVDKDRDGMLNIDEFMHMLYPKTDHTHALTRLHEPVAPGRDLADVSTPGLPAARASGYRGAPWGSQAVLPKGSMSTDVTENVPGLRSPLERSPEGGTRADQT